MGPLIRLPTFILCFAVHIHLSKSVTKDQRSSLLTSILSLSIRDAWGSAWSLLRWHQRIHPPIINYIILLFLNFKFWSPYPKLISRSPTSLITLSPPHKPAWSRELFSPLAIPTSSPPTSHPRSTQIGRHCSDFYNNQPHIGWLSSRRHPSCSLYM